MNIIKPSIEFFGEVPTDYENALKFIELAGRTCYKSEDKIAPGSAEKFVRKLIKAGHLAMIEHSSFVVRAPTIDFSINALRGISGKYLNVAADHKYTYVGGNLTAWFRLGELSNWIHTFTAPFICIYGDLFNIKTQFRFVKYWQVCPHDEIPKELHRYSAKFVCDRGVSHELVRHRPCSFAQESTRYVNYSGKEMEFIEPAGYAEWNVEDKYEFIAVCTRAEGAYKSMVKRLPPQAARAVLPNALKTEIVVTADSAEWAHIRKLRTSPASHPDIQRVMNMMPWSRLC